MKGQFTCVVCPTSCVVNAEWDEIELQNTDHAQCKLAWEYIRGEIFDPRRTLTSTVMASAGTGTLAGVVSKMVESGSVSVLAAERYQAAT